ncbi:MAG: hypothetical protein EOP35_09915 [Rubrivivax sp.]|nr:MAG: hypothetical protein EOP35_09915 [Rubrivivax sp.]
MSTPRLRSRLAQRLESDIAAAAVVPARCAVLQAQRAILWLRHGHVVEARKELNRLQGRALVHPNIELAAWLHLAEGLAAYFNSFGGGARDRVRRALVLAQAGRLESLSVLCEAWLAQMAFVDRDVDSVVVHAAAVFAVPVENASAWRIASALGMAWDLAGQRPLATVWYLWGRRAANAEGDEAGFSAILYNQVQMRILRIRHAAFAGDASTEPAELLGIDSVGNFDGAVGGSARADLTPLLRAQLLTVHGDFAEAAGLLEKHLPEAVSSGLARVGGSLLADLAWCWANTGELQRARALADQAAVEVLAEDSPDCDIDERAALHSRLAQVYARLREDALAARQAEAAAQAWAEDAAQRRHWAERLTAAGLDSPPN